MRVRLGVLALILATALLMVCCGSGTSTNGGQEDSTESAPTISPDHRGAWDDYRESLLAWADDLAAATPPETGYDEEGKPDLDDFGYRIPVEREVQALKDLERLERLEPPPELVTLHHELVEAFRGFCRADELYRETEAARDYLAHIQAGLMAQEQLDKVNDALLQLVQAFQAAE